MLIIQEGQILHNGRSISQLIPVIKQWRALVKLDLAEWWVKTELIFELLYVLWHTHTHLSIAFFLIMYTHMLGGGCGHSALHCILMYTHMLGGGCGRSALHCILMYTHMLGGGCGRSALHCFLMMSVTYWSIFTMTWHERDRMGLCYVRNHAFANCPSTACLLSISWMNYNLHSKKSTNYSRCGKVDAWAIHNL